MSAFRSLLVVLFALPRLAEDPRIGQKVFWKAGAKATVDDKEVAIGTVPFPAVASKAEGDRLWLETAWVEQEDVMLADDALAYYSEQIRGDAKNAALWRSRAVIRSHQGEHDSAIADYSEAIRLEPKDAQRVPRAWLHNTPKASSTRQSPTTMKPPVSSPIMRRAHYCRAVTWCAKGDFDKALGDYDEAIRLEPKLAWAYYGRAIVWRNRGEYDKAIADDSEAAAHRPRLCGCILRPRLCLGRQGGLRPGNRRLHRGDPPRPAIR